MGAVLIMGSVWLTVVLALEGVGVQTRRAVMDVSHGQTQRLAAIVSSRVVGLQLLLRQAAAQLPLDKLSDNAAMLDHFNTRPSLFAMFDHHLLVATPDGTITAYLDASGARYPTASLSDWSYFTKTVQQQRPFVSEPHRSNVSGQSIVVLTMPLIDAAGQVVGVMAGGVSLVNNRLLMQLTDLGSASEGDSTLTFVMDSAGMLVAHPDTSRILRDARDDVQLTHLVESWVQQGSPVEPSGLSALLGDQIVSMAGVPDADWMVVQVAQASTLLGGLQLIRTQLMWLGLAVSLAGGALLLLATMAITRPLKMLEKRALKMLDSTLPSDEGWPNVNGEVGQLSRVLRSALKQRQQVEATSHGLLARMEAVLGHSPVGILFTRDRKIELASASWLKLFGYGPEGLVGQSARVLYSTDAFYIDLGKRVGEAFSQGKPFDEEIEFVRCDGGLFWGRLQGAPVKADDPALGTIWVVEDITHERTQRQNLIWQSTRDPLTELYNRRTFETMLGDCVKDRRVKEPVSALFIDLDHFKQINDTAGHAAGDDVLKDVSKRILVQVRANDLVARLGGDEFALLLLSCDGPMAVSVADKIRASIASFALEWQGQTLRIGASIGVVEIDESVPTAVAVLAAADAACYAAKHAGRNRVQLHRAATL